MLMEALPVTASCTTTSGQPPIVSTNFNAKKCKGGGD